MSSTNTDLEDRDSAATSDESDAGVPADGVAGRTGLDGVALKPTECDVCAAADLPFGLVCVDYEGRESIPAFDWLAELARDRTVRVATPVRADGFDPRGDGSLVRSLPDRVGRIVVAGHPACLTDAERTRAIAPRIGDAVRAADDP